jgi:hypothetical protein
MERAAWYAVRRANSRKPATYTCPFCRRPVLAMSEHLLVFPEGDAARRRHAHGPCVAAARLPSRDDWLATQPRPPRWWQRLLRHR